MELEVRFEVRRGFAAIALMALGAACDGARTPSEPADFKLRFLVANNLIAPVTVAIDGEPQIGLIGGKSSGLAVPPTAQWLTWTSAKPLDARGNRIPDDIGEVKISVGGINGVLKISNVIADQTYITARVYNFTTAPVSIGVYDGSSVSCASELPGASSTTAGFTQIGYYRLLAATEVRAYRDPSRCTGPYVSWPRSELKRFDANSGLVNLALDSAP